MGSNLHGNVKNYRDMYNIIKDFNNGNHLTAIEMSLLYAQYYDWTEEDIQSEKDIYENVYQKYLEFIKALEDALGIINDDNKE
jgi:hypothetical protein